MAQSVKISDKAYTKLMKEAKRLNKEFGRQVTIAELIDELIFKD